MKQPFLLDWSEIDNLSLLPEARFPDAIDQVGNRSRGATCFQAIEKSIKRTIAGE